MKGGRGRGRGTEGGGLIRGEGLWGTAWGEAKQSHSPPPHTSDGNNHRHHDAQRTTNKQHRRLLRALARVARRPRHQDHPAAAGLPRRVAAALPALRGARQRRRRRRRRPGRPRRRWPGARLGRAERAARVERVPPARGGRQLAVGDANKRRRRLKQAAAAVCVAHQAVARRRRPRAPARNALANCMYSSPSPLSLVNVLAQPIFPQILLTVVSDAPTWPPAVFRYLQNRASLALSGRTEAGRRRRAAPPPAFWPRRPRVFTSKQPSFYTPAFVPSSCAHVFMPMLAQEHQNSERRMGRGYRSPPRDNRLPPPRDGARTRRNAAQRDAAKNRRLFQSSARSPPLITSEDTTRHPHSIYAPIHQISTPKSVQNQVARQLFIAA